MQDLCRCISLSAVAEEFPGCCGLQAEVTFLSFPYVIISLRSGKKALSGCRLIQEAGDKKNRPLSDDGDGGVILVGKEQGSTIIALNNTERLELWGEAGGGVLNIRLSDKPSKSKSKQRVA